MIQMLLQRLQAFGRSTRACSKTCVPQLHNLCNQYTFLTDTIGGHLWIRSDEGLTLETSAFRISVRWPIYIINSVDKTKFLYTSLDSVVLSLRDILWDVLEANAYILWGKIGFIFWELFRYFHPFILRYCQSHTKKF